MIALPPAVSGEDRILRDRAGTLTVRVAGSGRPMILLHSINAAASAAEVAPAHEWAKGHFRVYTPDLPGFGRSERARRRYTPRLYTDAVHDVLDLVAREQPEARPVHGFALSTGAEFLARAAMERPERFDTLTLVTPTGFTRRSDSMRGPEGSTREIGWLKRLFSVPAIGGGAYRQLTRPAVIRYFLRRTFGRDEIDETLWRYCCRSVRAPGASFAPLAFLSGSLFSRDIRTVYESLGQRIWLPHGTRGDFADFSGADWARAAENWTVQAFPTGALPFFEMPEAFLEAWAEFLGVPVGP
ncbi:MAG: alpha/beta hydrolase [Pseudomonadales bacterium]|jgi:pimeloyl-ACP methyl ester carboxylesterase|nr:alpha/beta hydrolase [Pseudomonadales bacterium]